MAVSDGLWLTLVSTVVFLVYLDHLVHSIALWREEHSARSFRGLFIAVMLQVGMFRILVGVATRAWPANGLLELLLAVTAPILTVMLLSGGLVMAWSWRTKKQWHKP